ncbi:DUF1304 family protein [Lacticaseibacillus hegangensis]|uniref:DUF1304 family protein n=1 Tax=Lacticaseibacillus hegangensis TaxID=2486010 RepID=A0ABW4D227_9LACO|nr:DUF1304 family protein [Lacticaseibacillus hegangensis]
MIIWWLKALLVLIGVEHLGIAVLEMRGAPAKQASVFGMPLEFVKQPHAQIALANQGVYNLMLGAAMLASAFTIAGAAFVTVALILLVFLLVVGVYGGVTVTRKIFLVQVLPAVIGLALVLIALMA